MFRVFLIIIALSFPIFADDVKDYQMEGISIGDSLLQYMSENEIKKDLDYIYENDSKTFGKDVASVYYEKNLNTYDVVQVNFKIKDNSYEILGLMGTIFFEESIEGCYKKQIQIFNELKLIFEDKEFNYSEGDHPGYPNGEVKFRRYSFYFVNDERSNFEIFCYEIDLEGYRDRLVVSLKSIEFNKWLEKVMLVED